ncbi:MAG: cobalamin-dependent protein [Candidatus Omnitrophica bacterium]|nr:cobalamin-dependent protein [Candidatus Omnitrophota bacterium]
MKLKITLCDLSHTGFRKSSEAIPLGIGYIASYLKEQLKTSHDLEIKLISRPDDLEDHLATTSPDIVGFSNFLWNTRLSRYYAEKVKEIYPSSLIIFGGPDFPSGMEFRKEYLLGARAVDFYVLGEGECGTLNIVSRYTANNGDRSGIMSAPIDGAVFIDNCGHLVEPREEYLFADLGSFPSPILSGLMDKFIIEGYTPMIQSVRGCPYKCTYCNEGLTVQGNVRSYPADRVLEELSYLKDKAASLKDRGSRHIIIADANFGVNKADTGICELIRKAKDEDSWPESIELTTGKSNKELLINNLSIISDGLQLTLALQSMNGPTLKAIERKNFTVEELLEIIKRSTGKDLRIGCELIVPMPEETFNTYLSALKYCVDLGMRVSTHTLVMLMETEMAQPETVSKYSMTTKYRVLYRAIGRYGGRTVIETEKICVSTKDYSFDEYIETRVIGCVNGIFLLNEMFAEIRAFLGAHGFSLYDWLINCYNHTRKSAGALQSVLEDFRNESRDELWDNENALFRHFSDIDNYNRLLSGEIGRNLITTYQGIVISMHYRESLEIAKQSMLDVVSGKAEKNADHALQIEDLARYLFMQNSGCFEKDPDGKRSGDFSYDIDCWIKDRFKMPLSYYKSPARFTFSHDEYSLRQIRSYIHEYGDNPEGYGRILVRINPKFLKRQVTRSV